MITDKAGSKIDSHLIATKQSVIIGTHMTIFNFIYFSANHAVPLQNIVTFNQL